MINYKLTLAENTVEALDANDAGELTEGQLELLLKSIEENRRPYRRPFGSFGPNMSVLRNRIYLLVAVGIAFVGMALLKTDVLRSRWFLLVLCVTVFVMLLKQAQENMEHNAHLDAMRDILHRQNYVIETYFGTAIFETGRVQVSKDKSNSLGNLYRICTNNYEHSFVVSRNLWERLHPKNGNVIENARMYYFTEPFLALLSVTLNTAPLPPSDAELMNVVGLGEDGELIFKKQDNAK